MAARRILGFPHRPQPHGGAGSFQLHLSAALEDRGFEIVYPDSGVQPDIVMVLPATRKLDWLLKCKRNGARIVRRLDGIHWRHPYMPIS